jgi:hypothetical protein
MGLYPVIDMSQAILSLIFGSFIGFSLGMLVGAGIFAEAYTIIKDNLLKWGDLGKLTIPEVAGKDL